MYQHEEAVRTGSQLWMSVEINSCPQILPFPEYQFAHTLNSTLTKLKLSKVLICSLSKVLRFLSVCTRRFKAYVTK